MVDGSRTTRSMKANSDTSRLEIVTPSNVRNYFNLYVTPALVLLYTRLCMLL